ncbi:MULTISPECIES: hypothetical protein, partial [Brevundimonas]|uniref:hypothetical protein n=1 Tax=Brevundimonas TaxID=41275 RepID=UPI0025BC793D
MSKGRAFGWSGHKNRRQAGEVGDDRATDSRPAPGNLACRLSLGLRLGHEGVGGGAGRALGR